MIIGSQISKHLRIVFASLSLMLFSNCGFGQSRPFINRSLNFGIAPGLNTNGMNPKNYRNQISLNIISNYSAANSYLEISGFSNFHLYSSSGICISGLVNIVGGNRFDLSEYSPNDHVTLSAYFAGLQAGSMLNLTTGDFHGLQVGGVNVIRYGQATGLFISGFSNYSGTSLDGVQISGGINFARKYVSGLQISLLINSTLRELYGMQIGGWNSAEVIHSFKSSNDVKSGMQLGAINIAGLEMGGIQLGIVNKGATMNGLQIGLVNINNKSNGYPIGLINTGWGRSGIRLWIDNISFFNAQVLTGSKHITNGLLVGFDKFKSKNKSPYAIGYSIGHTDHLRPGKIFHHAELMIRTVDFTFKRTRINPIMTVQETVSAHLLKGIYISVSVGINYDDKTYFERNIFFPSFGIGLSILEK